MAGDGSLEWVMEPIQAAVLLDIADALDENAKLRGLVRDVYSLHWSGLDCTECPWIGECETDGGCPWLGILHDHMRDLGIEVPQ